MVLHKIKNQTRAVPSLPKAFTLVELVVVITILAILGTIGFMSIGGYSSRARDSDRLADIANISKSLDLSVVTMGAYPQPDNSFSVTYSGAAVWHQGIVGSSVLQAFRTSIAGGGLNKKPVDPLKGADYIYSKLAEGHAYQLQAEYEGDISALGDNPFIDTAYAAPGNPTLAYVRGNYGGIAAKVSSGSSVYVLAIPSIITNSGTVAGGSLLTSSLSGTLLFHGKALKWSNSFSPNTVAYSGVKTPSNPSGLPNTSTGILAMGTALRSAYSGSDIRSHASVSAIVSASDNTAIQSIGGLVIANHLGGGAASEPAAQQQVVTNVATGSTFNSGYALALNTVQWYLPGSTTFDVPVGFTSADVYVIGGGGASYSVSGLSQGGGGGGFSYKNITLTAGQNIVVQVGGGGASDGQSWGTSSVNHSSHSVVATGGAGWTGTQSYSQGGVGSGGSINRTGWRGGYWGGDHAQGGGGGGAGYYSNGYDGQVGQSSAHHPKGSGGGGSNWNTGGGTGGGAGCNTAPNGTATNGAGVGGTSQCDTHTDGGTGGNATGIFAAAVSNYSKSGRGGGLFGGGGGAGWYAWATGAPGTVIIKFNP